MAEVNTALPARPDDLPAALLSDNARIVLAKRYLMKDDAGKVTEEPEDMFWRVAYTIAAVDAKYGATEEEVTQLARDFYEMMVRGEWEPNTPTLMNAGRPLGQLSACFVLPVEDALSSDGRNGYKAGIYDTLKSMALVHQSGGGTGFSFSRLRPSGAVVRSTMGVASGPVSFMGLYDASTEVVKQGGTRRGANMGILRVDHPDVLAFITCKADTSKNTNFNISVAVTDEFMRAVEAGTTYPLRDPRTGEKAGELDANEVLDLIIKNAWATGEPGLFFIDEANRYNPVPHLGSYEATNPCGEQPLLAFDVCNLGSANLGAFVDLEADDLEDWNARIKWGRLRQVLRLSTHFLDNVIDANCYPLPEITDLAQRIRRIGNGVMGYADLLVRLGIPYGSAEAIRVTEELAAYIDSVEKAASEELAEKRGTFPEWERSIWGPDATCARDADGNRIRPERRLRNCNVNTVAPTGTISLFANCSGGIEPLFAVTFMRNQAGAYMTDVNEDFVRIAKAWGFFSDELMERIKEEGHIHFDEVPEQIQRLFRTAHDVTPAEHVAVQAAWQKYTDSAISKTTNFPTEATEADVREVYLQAYRAKCKGVTVYRDGSRSGQVLSTGKTDKDKKADEKPAPAVPRARPAVLSSSTREMTTPVGDAFITISEHEGKPFEVFIVVGKAGSIVAAECEALGRLISLAMRSGVSHREIIMQLRGISSDRAVGFGENKVSSLPDAIAQALEAWSPSGLSISVQVDVGEITRTVLEELGKSFFGTCPECSSELTYKEGCVKCPMCSGYSQCG
jgi:ribonucleoside-diphosphate reductase alpha chain